MSGKSRLSHNPSVLNTEYPSLRMKHNQYGHSPSRFRGRMKAAGTLVFIHACFNDVATALNSLTKDFHNKV